MVEASLAKPVKIQATQIQYLQIRTGEHLEFEQILGNQVKYFTLKIHAKTSKIFGHILDLPIPLAPLSLVWF